MKISTLIRESAKILSGNPVCLSYTRYRSNYPAVVKNNKYCLAKNNFTRLWTGKLIRNLVLISIALLGLVTLPKQVHAQITQPTPWTQLYNLGSGTASGSTFAIAGGSNRILVVGITAALDGNGTIANPTTITYGGVTLTRATGDAADVRTHTWLYYLKDNAVMDNTARPLNITLGSSGFDDIQNMSVFYTVFAGVDQAPATYTTGIGFRDNASTAAAALSAAMPVIVDAQAVYVSSVYNSSNTTAPNYTVNTNWTTGAVTNTGSVGGGSNDSWRNHVAKRIPGTGSSDNAATSTISTSSQFSMSAMSLPRAPVVYTSITSGPWSSPGTWDLGSVPAAGSNVVITNGHTVNLTANTNTISSITVNGTLDVSTFALAGTGINNISASGTLLVGGATNFPSGFTTNTLSAGSTVNYNNAGTQTISGQAYSNLILSGSGAKTLLTGTTSITGTLSLTGTATTTTVVGITIGNLNIGDGTTFTAGAFPLTVTGTTTVGGGTNGSLTITSATGTKTFAGLVTINTGAVWTNTAANSPVTFRGGITNNGTYNSGTGVHTFDTNAQQLTGTFSIPSVTITGITLTNNNALTIGTALSGTGGLTQAANAILNLGGTSGITTLTAANNGNTVNYTGVAQTVHSNTYYNLTLAGSGAKTLLTGTTSIAGNLSLTGTATTATVVGLNIGGNLSIGDGTTFTAAGFALTVTGTTSVGTGVSGNLTVSSATGTKIFTGLVTVNAGGVWSNSGNSPVSFRGGITNSGTFSAGTGVHTFETNAQALLGNAFSIPSVTVTGVTLTNNNSLTVNGALSGTGTVQQAAGATLNIGAASALANIDATANGNNVTYTAITGNQTLIGGTYFNVNLNNTSGTNTANGNVIVNGAMIANGTGGTLSMSTFTLSGASITNNGTISTQNISANPLPAGSSWGGTINYNAATGGQTVVTGTYNNLTSGNSSGINSAAGDLIIDGALTTTALGTLNLGTNTISGTLATITNNGTISTANTTTTPLPTGLTWGGTINYNALTGGQTLVTGTYNNLTLSNTSGTSTPTSDLVINGTLTITAGGTLDMLTNAITGTLASVVNNGTVTTGNITSTPVPSGKTWGGSFIYAGASAQTVVTGTYSNLAIPNTLGAALGGAVTVNTSLTLGGSLTLGANNLTLGFSGAVAGVSSSLYIVTNGTGQLRRTVGASQVNYPVGNSAYNPIAITNAGTSDVYGINVVDGPVNTAIDPSLAVDRRWQVTEAVAGGSNLAITAQYNSGETTADFTTGNPIIGLYNGTAWIKTSATYSGGPAPFNFTSLVNLVVGDLTSGTQYIALAKDYAFVAGPTQFAITSIVPNPVISGSGFQVTIESHNAANEASNVAIQSFFNLSTNGNAGALSGTVSGSIPAGLSTVTLNGVLFSSLGTGATITATLDGTNGGDALTPGTSTAFNVVGTGASDIIAAANETPNIDYKSKTGSLINTTSDGIRVWSFNIRDGGSTPDADNLATILNALTLTKGAGNTVTSWVNTIQEAALFDGPTKVAEITVAGESLAFTSLNSGAGVTVADNTSKTLDLYFTFKTANITDGQQFQFAITNANASADAGGSLFNAFTTPISSVAGTNNRVQVTASQLVFGAQALTDVAVGANMTPPFTIRGVDINNNLDLDYTSTIILAVNGSTFNGAAPGAAAVAGVATFSPVFASTGTGVTITGSDGVITNTPPSNTFNVTSIVPVVTDLFRSKITGDWDQLTTWQQSHEGTNWFDAGVIPTNANSSSITILNGHTVTVPATLPTLTIDQTTINTGGQVTVASGVAVTVNDGTGTDVTANGTLSVSGTVINQPTSTIAGNASTLLFNANGTYVHNQNGGAVITATWNANSTCKITGFTNGAAGALTNLGQTFGNFVWDCPGQTTALVALQGSGFTGASGTLTVNNTGTGSLYINSTTTGTPIVVAHYLQTGGTVVINNGNASRTLTVTGNFTLNQDNATSSFQLSSPSGSGGTQTLNVGGNFTIAAGTMSRAGNGSTVNVNLNGTTTQVFSKTGGTITGIVNFIISPNAIVDFGTSILDGSSGTFNLNAGGSIITAHAQGVSTSNGTGTIQVTGTKSYNATGNYTYNGISGQLTGNGLTTANNLTINNPAGVSLTSATTVNGTLTLTSGLLSIGTNNLTTGASAAISGVSSTAYVQTNGSGLLRRTVAVTPVLFPVGISAYNPITLTNSGTSDVYGITAIEGAVPNAQDVNFTVNRRWRINENISGGSNVAIVAQYNSGEEGASFTSGNIPKIGFFNGTVWTENGATQAGADPFTFTSVANFTPTNLTTGTQYFALGKDQAFAPLPQGTLTANSICVSGVGQLTFTATSGTSPFTIVYNDGTANVTQPNVISGTPFNVTPNPTTTTTYTLVSATDNDGDTRNSGFTGGSATITVNPAIADNTITASQSVCTGATPAPMTGSVPTGGNGTYGFLWQSSTASATTGFANAAGTNNGQNYTPSAGVTQTTWYRRVITSGGCIDNSTAIQVTVTPAPTITPGATLTATQSCSPAAITLTGASFGAPATSAAWSIVSGGGTLSNTGFTATPSTVTYTPAPGFTGAVSLALTTDACSGLSANRTVTVNLPTIVNYDFNTGTSFATLTSNAVANITSTASGTNFATSATGTVTGGNAFTPNATAGNSLSQTATANNNWTFTLTGTDVRFYKTFRVYFNGQRNSGATPQNIEIQYSINGGAFSFVGNQPLNNIGPWVESTWSLPVAADNPSTSIAVRLNVTAGSGTILIDNFQIQGIYTPPADKTPTAALSPVCEGTGTNIQIPASQLGVNYQLRNNTGNVNIGSPVAGTGSTINLPTGNLTTATTYNVLASNSCSVQMANTVTVNVTSLASLNSTLTPPDICTNTAFNYTPTSSTSGTTFNWSRAAVTGISNAPATGAGDPNETLINTTTTAKNVTYQYTLTANGCTNPTVFNVVVVVNPTPALSSSLTPPAVCDANPFQYIPASETPGASFNWSRAVVAGISNAAATGTDDPNETLFNTTSAPVNVTYEYTLSANGCVNPTPYNVVVVVEPSPSVIATDTVVSNTAGICGASITLGNNVTTNGTLSYSVAGDPITMPHTFAIGTTNVTVTAENNCGTSTTFFDVTVNDTEAPAIPVLANVTGECSATATPPTTTDNCAGIITGATTDPLTYLTQGTFQITWTFDDGNGNISTATQNVVVDDVTPPADPLLADVTGECSATATIPTATDNCAGTITGTTSDALTYSTQGTHVIHWSFDDGNGNVTTITQNVVVDDVTPPVEPNLADVTGECTATATIPTTTDNCSGTITGTTSDELTYSTQGTHVIHWSFDDGNGNIITVTQNVVVDDVTPPAEPTLDDITGECTATATIPTTTDNCSGTITGSTSDPLTYSTQGTHVIHWSFDDGNGNITTATQNVVIDDVTAPDEPTLADVTGECSATAIAPTTTDNCSGIVTGTTSDLLTYSTQGTHIIHWSFDDGNGNITTATQNVVIDDVTAPDEPTLADVTGECSATATAPTTTDNCSGIVTGTTSDLLTYSTQGTHIIHWSFDDGNGNITTATQNVVIDDVTPPAAPTLDDITGECTATATIPTTTDNCSGTINGTTSDPLTYSTQGIYVIHWSFDDGNGNITTVTQNVVVDDVTPPAPPVLTDINGECTATATPPTTTDNCSGTITGSTSDPLTYSTQGTHVIHWSFDDGNGNISTATQNVIINDAIPPVPPVLADVTGECTATATVPTTTDNCTGNTITGTTADPLTYSTQGTHIIHWSFDDGNGNISTATQNVIITDVTVPAVPDLADVTGECSATATTPTTTDNCSGTIIGTTADPLTYSTQGTFVIHWSFDDGNGNISTATQNVIISDVTPPAIPSLVNVTGECSATVTPPTTTDNCTGTITGTTTDPLTYSTQGTHVIHWSFDDGNGNISTATQNIVIDDVTAPAIPVLASVTGQCSATATPPTTTDNCTGTITGTTTDPLTYSTQGTHVIHWSFDDGNGNISTATQNVVIDDITAPVVPALANVTGECSATATPPTTTDDCAGTITGTTTDPLTYSTSGTHVIHWSFDDGNGNMSTATQNVVINDVTAPVVPLLANITGQCSATVTAPTTTDNCTGTVTGTTTDPLTYSSQGTYVIHWNFDDGNGNISTTTQDVVIDDITAPVVPVLSNVTGQCSATVTPPTTSDNCAGTVTGTTTDPLTYTTQGTFIVNWSFNDGNGNISTTTQNVVIDDITPPAVPVLASVTGECSATATAPTTTDNCTGTVTGTTTDPLTYSTQGTHVIHWSFDDGNGNISTATQNVIIQDVTGPTVSTAAGSLNATLECDDDGSLTLALSQAPVATDNCGQIPTIHQISDVTTPDPLCANGYTRVRTWNFTDANNNPSANFVQTITVQDHTPPFVVQMPADVTVNADANCQATGVNLGILSAQDNCSPTVTITNDHPSIYPIGNTIVTWTIKDDCNNTITRQQTVRVVDHTNPVIANCPAAITVFTGAGALTCNKGVSWTPPSASDNCSVIASFTSNYTPGAIFPIGTTLVTYLATDASTNSSTCSFNVTVVDNTVPVISNCPASIVTCNPNVTWTAPTASDNCGVTTFINDAPASFPVGVTTVTYTAKDAANNTTTCSFTVTVNPTPSALAASNSPICSGNTISLSSAGGTSYSWTGPNSFSSNLQNPSIGFATIAATGTYTVIVSNTFGCTATATTNVVVNAGATATAASNTPVCTGGTLNLSATGGVSYNWTGPNGFVSLQQNPTISNITNTAGGIYTVTVTNASSCTAQAFTSVSVGVANAFAANNGPLCEGSTLSLSAAGGSTYSWTGPNGFSSTQQNPAIANATTAANGIYTVTVTGSGGCTAITTTNVTVNANPTALAANNGPVCQGGTLSLSAAGGTSYNWTGPNGFSSFQQNPVISNIAAAAAGFYTVTVSNASGCSSTAVTQVVLNAAAPASAASNSPICNGGTLTLFANAGASYSWTGPNGFSSIAQNPTLLNVNSSASGIYTVTVTSASGCISTAATNVVISALPVASVSANGPLCEGSLLNLSASGGTSYSWTGPNGFLSNQQNPSLGSITTAATGSYTVTVTNGASCTASASVFVQVNTAPVATASSNGPVCSGATLNLFANGGATYSWTGPNGFSSTQQNPVIINASLAAGGTYTVSVTNAGGCTATTTTNVTVNSGAAAVASSTSPVCPGATLNLFATGGVSYSWTGPNGFISTDQNPAISNVTVAAGGIYTVTVTTSGGCTGTTTTSAVINAASAGGNVSGTTAVCSGSNSGVMNLTGHTGNVIRWESSTDGGNTWATISNTTTSQTYNNLAQTTHYRAVVQSGSCTPANSVAAIITVNTTAVGGTVSGSTTVCTGNNSGTVLLSGQAGAIIKWQFSTDGGGSWTDMVNTTTSQSYTNLTQPTQYRAVIGGCSTVNSSAATITVTPASVGGAVSGTATVCSGGNSGTMNVTGQTGNVIRWEFSTNGGNTWSTISNTTTSQTYTNLTQTTQYRAVALSGVCISANSSAAIITVNGSVAGGTVSGSTTVCSGSNSGTLTLSGHSGAISKWQFSTDGGGIWTDISNTTTTQAYSNLTQTTQYRAVISGCATTANSGAATITIGSSLAVTIAASDAANEFCNKLTLTANASLPVQSYLWSNSATTQSIKLGGANAAGNYTVTVTAVGGCTGTATYNYAPQAVASNYTILGLQTVSLFTNNTVQNGSVGATQNNGTITIGNTSSVAAPGAFVKASVLSINAGANVPVRITSPAAVPLPVMQFNNTSTSALSNVTVPNNTNGTLNGNYRNLTIGTNCNITLTGTIFRLIIVGSRSTIRFSQPVINVGGINLDQGNIATPTTVAFSQACVVKSNADINIASLSSINPDNHKVIFYIGNSSGTSSPDFNVSTGGNITVNAHVYVPNGDISVGGNNINNTFMNGKFIASLVKSNGQRVIWNSYDCATTSLITRTTTGNASQATITPVTQPELSFMTATVTPVPTESFFTLRIKSSSQENVVMKIYDIVGRQVEQFNGSPDQAYRFGDRYMQGTYIVEVHQGNKVKVMQVVKL